MMAPAALPVVTRRELFLGFLHMGLVSFGGVLPWARRILVEQKSWLTADEFVEMLGIGQALPGPNVVNLSIMVGNRFHGAIGALLSIAGLLLAPLAVILVLALLYGQYGGAPDVQRAVAGTAAAGAGLVLAMGIRMALQLPRQWHVLGVAATALAGAGMFGWPLPQVLAVLAPLSLFLAWRARP
jgi:chromate transporter